MVPPPAGLARSALAVDRDALGFRLRTLGLGQHDGQHAVLESGADLVVLDLVAKWYAALEATVEALRELTVLVFGFGPLLS